MENITLNAGFSKEIHNATQKFSKHLSKPQQKNFREIIRGMIISGSSYLKEIGDVRSNGNNKRKNVERLSNMLDKVDTEIFHQIHINSQIQKYRNESVLIFQDGGDFQKPHAKKMEKVCKNVDGSNRHKVGQGYPLLGIAAYGLESGQLNILAQHLWSTKSEDFKSEWDEHKKILSKLDCFIESSIYDRIIVEDRGGDDQKRFFYYLDELKVSFVTRVNTGVKSRHVLVDNEHREREKISIKELANRMRKKAKDPKIWKNKKIKKTLTSSIAHQKVFLPEREDTPLYLIFVFTEGFDDPLVILTDLVTENTQTAWKHFFYYKKRWEIENFFRAEKQNLNAEKFLIRKFDKIKSLAFIFMFAISLLADLQQKIISFLGSLYYLFQNFCKREQKTGKHSYLDILAFLRDCLVGVDKEYAAEFCMRKISKYRFATNPKQIKLIDFRKN